MVRSGRSGMLITATVIRVRGVAHGSRCYFRLEDGSPLERAGVRRFRSTSFPNEILISARSLRKFVRWQNSIDKVEHIGSGTDRVSREFCSRGNRGSGCRRQGRLRGLEQICQIVSRELIGTSPETFLVVSDSMSSFSTGLVPPTLLKG
jgi:hypothetical protein